MLITSKDNPTIKTIHALLTQARLRKKLNQTVLEGVHLIDAYLNSNHLPLLVLVSKSGLTHPEIAPILSRLSTTKLLTVDDTLYKHLRSLGESLPIMALIKTPTPLLDHPLTTDCLIVNGVQDNGNLGTLLRTASAVGFDTIVCTTGTAQAWSPKTLRAGMGAQFSLNIYENVSVTTLLTYLHLPCYATSSHADKLIYEHQLCAPLALIMGNEGQGVDAELLTHATPLALPQPNGQESLNVGVAGSVCLYEILRQRQYAHS